jgi:hypothetical protein
VPMYFTDVVSCACFCITSHKNTRRFFELYVRFSVRDSLRSLRSQNAKMTRTTNAIKLGQTGISTPPATMLIPNIALHNCAKAMMKRKIDATRDAGRFIMLPFCYRSCGVE